MSVADLRDLASQIGQLAKAPDLSPLRLRQVTVQSYSAGIAQVRFPGSTTNVPVAVMASYFPQAGEVAWLLQNGPDLLLIGTQSPLVGGAWVPTVGGTGWAKGAGGVTEGEYYLNGRVCHFKARFTAGSGSTAGSAGLSLTLPFTFDGLQREYFDGHFVRGSTRYRLSPVQSGSTVLFFFAPTTTTVLSQLTSTTISTAVASGGLTGAAYASGDIIDVCGSYPVAWPPS